MTQMVLPPWDEFVQESLEKIRPEIARLKVRLNNLDDEIHQIIIGEIIKYNKIPNPMQKRKFFWQKKPELIDRTVEEAEAYFNDDPDYYKLQTKYYKLSREEWILNNIRAWENMEKTILTARENTGQVVFSDEELRKLEKL